MFREHSNYQSTSSPFDIKKANTWSLLALNLFLVFLKRTITTRRKYRLCAPICIAKIPWATPTNKSYWAQHIALSSPIQQNLPGLTQRSIASFGFSQETWARPHAVWSIEQPTNRRLIDDRQFIHRQTDRKKKLQSIGGRHRRSNFSRKSKSTMSTVKVL